MKNLRNLIFLGALLLTTPSCSSIGSRAVTLESIFPTERYPEENEQRYSEKSDSTYSIESKKNLITKDGELRANYIFMQSD